MEQLKNTILITILLISASLTVSSQVTYEDNDPGNNTPLGFLGWNDNTNEELLLMQNDRYRLRFNSINWNGINGADQFNATRIAVPLWDNPATAFEDIDPIFSMMHLGEDSNINLQRDWMNVGTTYSASVDLLYIGLMERPIAGGDNNITDAVLAWGCNDDNVFPENGPDNFRFLFITPTDESSPGADSQQGRETMRITPMGNVGIGDFSSMPLGLNEQPTFRLDVDGNARFRQIQQAAGNVLITGKQENAAGDYSLRYLEFPQDATSDLFLDDDGNWVEIDTDGEDLDWETDGTNVWSGHGTNGYPGRSVGIGAATSFYNPNEDAKLYITRNNVADNDINKGIGIRISHPQLSAYGGYFEVGGNDNSAMGLILGVSGSQNSFGQNPQYPIGLMTRVFTSNTNTRPIGVYANTQGGTNGIGVYGYSQNGDAGWFVGGTNTTGGQVNISDASVKTNVNSIEGAAELLLSLQPRSYNYLVEEYPELALENGTSHGFIAQEVQEVIPSIVKEVLTPPLLDSTGTAISEQHNLLGIKYNEFIPLLVAGYQERQAVIDQQASTISELQNQIDELYTMVADCCADASNRSQNTGENTDQYELEIEKPSLDQNVPNPFQEKTTITYRLPEQTSIKVLVSDSKGNLVETLVEGQMPEGEYTIRWDATGLESGIYFYSLQSNGIELVKRAVKL